MKKKDIEVKKYNAIFSGQDLKLDNESFTDTNLKAIFGGIDLDLTKANFTSDVTINIFCMFGGIDVFVPENVNLEVKSRSIFGGVTNKRKASKGEQNNTIFVNATCLFGGVDIK